MMADIDNLEILLFLDAVGQFIDRQLWNARRLQPSLVPCIQAAAQVSNYTLDPYTRQSGDGFIHAGFIFSYDNYRSARVK